MVVIQQAVACSTFPSVFPIKMKQKLIKHVKTLEKTLFGPANAMSSTNSLVKIYNKCFMLEAGTSCH